MFLILKIKEYDYTILSFPGGLKTSHKHKNKFWYDYIHIYFNNIVKRFRFTLKVENIPLNII